MTPILAQRLRADRSFERLYRRHAHDVYRYTLAVLNNPADAEDVTQTTFLNAYRALQQGERPRVPHHWLIKIAHNACRQRFRQASRRVAEVTLDENLAAAAVVDDEPAPSADDIRRAMGHLAFNQRAALVMRELEGRSYAEIADLLGVSVSAVETLIFRARRALREQLEGTLTCAEAERAISRQLDGRLERRERAQLRAHLRECADCAKLARRQRAQRAAVKALGVVPLPPGLASLLGAGTGAGVAAGTKAAAVVAAGAIATGVAVEGAKQAGWEPLAKGASAERAAPSPAAEDARVAPAAGLAADARGRASAGTGDARESAAAATSRGDRPGRDATPNRARSTQKASARARAARSAAGRTAAKPAKPAQRASAVARLVHRARPGAARRAVTRAAGRPPRAVPPTPRAARGAPRATPQTPRRAQSQSQRAESRSRSTRRAVPRDRAVAAAPRRRVVPRPRPQAPARSRTSADSAAGTAAVPTP